MSLRLFFDRHKTSLHQTYLAAIFLLFIFATIHVAARLATVIEVFVLAPNISSDAYFANAHGPLNSLKIVAFLSSIVVADVVMVRSISRK